MRLNILIGGSAGQGINKISEIVSDVLVEQGYFIFNYRDYPSLIRGGHNFNVLSISDERVGSYESQIDGIVAMDENTIKVHKDKLKKDGVIIDFKLFEKDDLGRNLNIALSGALIKILGIDKQILIKEKIWHESNRELSIQNLQLFDTCALYDERKNIYNSFYECTRKIGQNLLSETKNAPILTMH